MTACQPAVRRAGGIKSLTIADLEIAIVFSPYLHHLILPVSLKAFPTTRKITSFKAIISTPQHVRASFPNTISFQLRLSKHIHTFQHSFLAIGPRGFYRHKMS
jgi:hypothetical protein